MTKLFILLIFPALGFAQLSESEINSRREDHKKELADTLSDHPILNIEDWKHFKGLQYFHFDSTYQLIGNFTKDKGKWFQMPTSTDRLPVYRRFGYVKFKMDSSEYQLTVYQNKDYRKGEFKGYLFIPFRDGTSSVTTYGGGRYLDAEIPKTRELLLDFNLAYNPYCAYSHRYSCPIPPAENSLKVKIEAGERTPLEH